MANKNILTIIENEKVPEKTEEEQVVEDQSFQYDPNIVSLVPEQLIGTILPQQKIVEVNISEESPLNGAEDDPSSPNPSGDNHSGMAPPPPIGGITLIIIYNCSQFILSKIMVENTW